MYFFSAICIIKYVGLIEIYFFPCKIELIFYYVDKMKIDDDIDWYIKDNICINICIFQSLINRFYLEFLF